MRDTTASQNSGVKEPGEIENVGKQRFCDFTGVSIHPSWGGGHACHLKILSSGIYHIKKTRPLIYLTLVQRGDDPSTFLLLLKIYMGPKWDP